MSNAEIISSKQIHKRGSAGKNQGAVMRELTGNFFSTNGATIQQPRATPWGSRPQIQRGPTARPKCHASVRADLWSSVVLRGADLGRRPIQGVALRYLSVRALPLKKGGAR
jgi:hypothetical protein